MTYKKLYKIIENETKKGETDIIDKWILEGISQFEIIKMIDYLSNFIETNAFKEMKYWKDYSLSNLTEQKIKNQRQLERDILTILINKTKREISQKNNTIKNLNYYLNLVQ